MFVSVKLIRPWNGYNPGEIAGFGPEIAELLIAKEIAILNTPPAPVEPVADVVDEPAAVAAEVAVVHTEEMQAPAVDRAMKPGSKRRPGS